MSKYESHFVAASDSERELGFYAESPKGVVRAEQASSGGGGGNRAPKPSQEEIDEHRAVAYGDPHVHEAIETLTDWIVGNGFNIQPRNVAVATDPTTQAARNTQAGTGEQDPQQVARLRGLLQNSKFWSVLNDWVRYALIDGHAFMELVVEEETFKPKLLPTERMGRKVDKYGQVTAYELEKPQGGSGSGNNSDVITYKPHEIAELYFWKEPGEDFGRSAIEPIMEQADMLRDMEYDYARFIATKAYPPVLWKLGNENSQWTSNQIGAWMDNVEGIGPDSMLAAPHDVETEIVGTTSTSSTAGAMRLEATFEHLEDRVVTGMGIPSPLLNLEGGSQSDSIAAMPSFKRRIDRLRNIVSTAVEQQVLKSLLTESAGLDTFQGTLPVFEFGEHSSAEKRLEIDKLLKLFNNGLLTAEALAERAGIDPDELPEMWTNGDLLGLLQQLSGSGDSIQNPSGGAPTSTQGGTESSGGEVTSRQDPGSDSSSGRNRKSITEDEN